MADCLTVKVIKEVGAVLATITTANSYSVTLGSIYYDFPTDYSALTYPCAIAQIENASYEDETNSGQEGSMDIKVIGYIEQTTAFDTTITGRTALQEFGADIRTALYTMFTRQQAGTFDMSQFELVKQFKQTFFSLAVPGNLAGVLTEFTVSFTANFTER